MKYAHAHKHPMKTDVNQKSDLPDQISFGLHL